MAEFASNAKGNAALATGIIGTAGVVNSKNQKAAEKNLPLFLLWIIRRFFKGFGCFLKFLPAIFVQSREEAYQIALKLIALVG